MKKFTRARPAASIYNAPRLREIGARKALEGSRSPASKKTDWIAVAALVVAAVSLLLAAGAVVFSIKAEIEKGNAELVQIGVNVLRVDPEKEKEISAATRKWALDLIDANAGGVKFSSEARAQLLKSRLEYTGAKWGSFTWDGDKWGADDTLPNNSIQPPR